MKFLTVFSVVLSNEMKKLNSTIDKKKTLTHADLLEVRIYWHIVSNICSYTRVRTQGKNKSTRRIIFYTSRKSERESAYKKHGLSYV